MQLYVETPVFDDFTLSEQLGCKISLKMDCFQPTGSFKIRGIGLFCQQAKLDGIQELICASGGNAGMATAYAGRKLGMKVTIVVPKTTKESVCAKIRGYGATVLVNGAVWDETAVYAKSLAQLKKVGTFPLLMILCFGKDMPLLLMNWYSKLKSQI